MTVSVAFSYDVRSTVEYCIGVDVAGNYIIASFIILSATLSASVLFCSKDSKYLIAISNNKVF